MTSKFVELSGVQYGNKGAHLMLLAARDAVERMGYKAALNARRSTTAERRRDGLAHLVDLSSAGKASAAASIFKRATALLPAALGRLNLVTRRRVHAILDGAGFAYSDQMGPIAALSVADAVSYWRPRGVKYIMLPQAFGPFENPIVRASVGTILQHADLVYVRDRQSYDYLKGAFGERPTFRLAPDFTITLGKGTAVAPEESAYKLVLLVPNGRMIDRTSLEVSQRYLGFMEDIGNRLLRRGLQVKVLVHEDRDLQLASNLASKLGNLPILADEDPIKLKHVIASADALIGSRFHALVGALSQTVPAIAIGWSHKYQELFSDAGCPQCVLPVDVPPERVDATIDGIMLEPFRSNIRKLLHDAYERQTAVVNQMWREIETVLRGP